MLRHLERARKLLASASTPAAHVQLRRLERLCFDLWELTDEIQMVVVRDKKAMHEQRGFP
jgi:hypothetical protein